MQCVAAYKHCCGEECENVSQHTNTSETSDGDESSFDNDDGIKLVDENDGIVNDAWDDEGSLILFRTEQFHILLCLLLSILIAIFQVDLVSQYQNVFILDFIGAKGARDVQSSRQNTATNKPTRSTPRF